MQERLWKSRCFMYAYCSIPFEANIAVVIVSLIVAAIIIAFLYLHASDVHQHTFKRSRVQNLRAYKTWILSNSCATGWRIELIT